MKLRHIATASLMLAAASSHAGLISYAGYTRDGSSQVISSSSMEWLMWTATELISIEDYLAGGADALEGGGWSLASNTEMATLFNDFGFCGASFDTLESTSQSCSTDLTTGDAADEADRNFVALFGNTYEDYAYNTGADDLEYASALFGSDRDGDGLFNIATVYDDRSWHSNYYGRSFESGGFVSLSGDREIASRKATYLGLALVRGLNDQAAFPVPAPGTGVLLTLGLLGLGYGARRKAAVT